MVRGALEVVVVVVVGPCSLSWGIDCVIDRLHSFRLFRGKVVRGTTLDSILLQAHEACPLSLHSVG